MAKKTEQKEEIHEEEETKIEVEPIETPEEIKDIEEETKIEHKTTALDNWQPKTSLGKKVKEGKITNISQILDKGETILEKEITEALLPNLEMELLLVGQSKGKFGGGSRRIFKQTQKKTPEGNKPSFLCLAAAGNKDGYIGIGLGKSKDTVPSREKAIRQAKLNIFKIIRGCGSWECGCKTPHSIPFTVIGKSGSAWIKLMPAPKGKGLVVEKECAKVLKLAGIKDVFSRTKGQTGVKINLIKACIQALEKLSTTKTKPEYTQSLGMTEGAKE